jgi:antitoxin YefM
MYLYLYMRKCTKCNGEQMVRRLKSKPSHVTYTDFRERLAAYMDQVWDSRAPLHVTRQGGRSVVVLSEEEFGGWVETVHLLRSPANARRLLESIAGADAGKLQAHELIEPEE